MDVLFRTGTTGTFTDRRDLTASPAGTWTTSYVTLTTQQVYAATGEGASPTRSIAVVGPLGQPASAARGPFTLSARTDAGAPIGWAPCRTIPYSLNLTGAPAAAAADIRTALAHITAITGLRFTYAGPTGYVPYATSPGVRPAAAALVVAFSDARRVPKLVGNVAGYAGTGGWRSPGRRRA